ncbi:MULTISPECIES: hypothetical protein [Cohnella]|uniref:Replicative DNA helicase n=1 Tax=Cohnella fermenti TaxID=2565925 RepID=A0A4S4BN64_9BACL|nr:hypothetical protein [Cohnella fermenti]THF75372.1 hypothetical protein E6C55_22260 [Cohnella fermenti]
MERVMDDAIKGYGERVKRLAIMDPLFRLKYRKRNEEDENVDWFSMGLLSLLFFFECMLQRQFKKGVPELSDFLYSICGKRLQLSRSRFHQIAETIVQTYRDPTGKRQEEQYWDWETRITETYSFSILKTAGFDKSENRQYYTLDEAGIELIFATKEYYSEFRISINQLLIRKQLEKGEFVNALTEIHEMRIAVEVIREQMRRLGMDVVRNIVSDETYQKFLQIVKDTHSRLVREDEEFKELYNFVMDTTQKQSADLQTSKDLKAYEQLLQISKELGEVHHLHQLLLKEAIQLKNKAFDSAKQALYSIGLQTFHFDHEIVSRLVSSPLPPLAAKGLATTFTSLHRHRSWSLLTVFDKQRSSSFNQEPTNYGYPEVDDEQVEQNRQIQQKNFSLIMKQVLEIMKESREIELKELSELLPSHIVNHRSYYDFWLVLHQRSPARWEPDRDGDVMNGALVQLEGDVLVVTECIGVIQPAPRFAIQNMRVERRLKEREI